MTSKSQMLGQMGGSCSFPRAAFEVNDRYDLKMFARLSVRDVITCFRSTVLIKILANVMHLLSGVRSPTRRRSFRSGAFAFQMKFLKVTLAYTYIL